MGFFAEFVAWLDTVLLSYIAEHTAILAAALEPLAVTLGTLYLMVWSYLSFTGQIQEPVVSLLKRFVGLAVVFGLAIHLWWYNEVIVTSVFQAPAALAALLVGAFDATTVIDQILNDGADAASALMGRSEILDGWSFFFAGLIVYLLVGVTAAYAMFLLSLSKVALSILLAVGPLFLLFALFESTRRFVESWTAQLINYALITVMTTLIAALMLHVMSQAAAAALAAGGEITIAHGMRVCLAAGLTLLVMRQVLPMCAGLASGLGLVTHNAMSQTLLWLFGKSTRVVGNAYRARLDRKEQERREARASGRSDFHSQRRTDRFRYNSVSRG